MISFSLKTIFEGGMLAGVGMKLNILVGEREGKNSMYTLRINA